MEALALGLPVVSTRVGGIAELVTDGEDAVLVPASRPDRLADALIALARDPQRRAAMAECARARERHARREAIGRSRRGRVPGDHRPVTETPGAAGAIDVRRATAADRPAVLALLADSLGWERDADVRRVLRVEARPEPVRGVAGLGRGRPATRSSASGHSSAGSSTTPTAALAMRSGPSTPRPRPGSRARESSAGSR